MELKIKTPDALEKANTAERAEYAYVVLLTKAAADTIRPIVKQYQREILARHRWPEFDNANNIVLDPLCSFLLSEDHFSIYSQECHAAAIRKGFKVEPGKCPLLKAEEAERTAKRNLIKIWEPALGIGFDDILHMGHYERYVDLLLGMAAKKL